MQLVPNASNALDKWLGPSTWSKEHTNDMNRFYDFIDQYQKSHGYDIDGSSLVQEVEGRLTMRGETVGNELREIIRDRIGLSEDILAFLKRTGR